MRLIVIFLPDHRMPPTPTPTPLNPLAGLRAFLAHLEARARSGATRIQITPDARQALREICRMKPGRMVFSPQPPPAADAPAPAPASVPVPDAAVRLTRAEKETRLAAVAARAEASPKARALGTLRDIMVFATGNPDADIMLVGEAPGAVEEQKREPFTGPAGATLDRILKAMGLDRGSVYISNICKFRPAIASGPQGNSNRKPTLLEMDSCLEYVREEIAIIQPRVIIALGATAAEGLLRSPVTVGKVRGQWLEYEGIPLMVTFHPSYILRKEADGEPAASTEKRKLWEDMLKVMDRLGLPVSDKQRRFFLPR
jgi:DNA polymerase